MRKPTNTNIHLNCNNIIHGLHILVHMDLWDSNSSMKINILATYNPPQAWLCSKMFCTIDKIRNEACTLSMYTNTFWLARFCPCCNTQGWVFTVVSCTRSWSLTFRSICILIYMLLRGRGGVFWSLFLSLIKCLIHCDCTTSCSDLEDMHHGDNVLTTNSFVTGLRQAGSMLLILYLQLFLFSSIEKCFIHSNKIDFVSFIHIFKQSSDCIKDITNLPFKLPKWFIYYSLTKNTKFS